MTTTDWTLMLVKGLGLYLLANAIFVVPSLIMLACSVALNWGSLFPVSDSQIVTPDALRIEFTTQFVAAIARLLIYGGLGLYFVSRKQVPQLISP